MKCKDVILHTVFVVVMLFCFTIFVSAENATSNELYSKYNIELSEEVQDVLESLGFEDFSAEEFSDISIKDTFQTIVNIFKGSMKQPFSCMCTLIGIILLCSLASGFVQQNQSISVYFNTVVTLSITLAAFVNVIQCLTDAVSSMYSAGILMKSLIPATAALAAFSGSPSLAVSYNAVAMYCAEIISAICRDFLTPVLCAFSAVAVCMSVNSAFNSDSIMNSVKKIISVLLGLCGTVYTGILALKDVLAVGIDKVAVKGVKFVLGSTVPVVGSALSEGLSSVIASVSLMKNIYGTIGIIVIVVTTLPAVCEMILWMITFAVTEYAAQSLGLLGVSKALASLRYVVSMMLSILLFTVYILIVSSAMIILLGNK